MLGIGLRLALTGALLLTEILGMTVLVDTGNLRPSTPTAQFVQAWGARGLRVLLMSVILALIAGAIKTRHSRKAIAEGASDRILSPAGAVFNLVALAAFAYLSLRVFSAQAAATRSEILVLPCVFSGLVMIASTALVFVPLEMWRRFFRAAPLAPVYGLGMSLAATGLSEAGKWIWVPWMRLTYRVVAAGLHLVRGNVVADPANFTVGTANFSVVIASGCSGYEGVALMLVFGSVWLWFFRREFRFPQAFLLLPVGAAAIWVLNCARIIALILIGDAGAPAVAAGGFHSEAGWISFVVLAAAVSLVSLRVPWIAVTEPRSAAAVPLPLRSNQTAAYLLPFLAILAAGMAARAASASFEWLYPLRVLAAGAMLWFFRRNYSGLNWRIGWQSAAAGGLVFAVWIAAAGVPHVAPGMPPELAAASSLVRYVWLAFRVAGAVVTVPIAEELAFRGYALRRLQSAEFTSVDLRKFRLAPLAISSLLFGLLHGRLWIAGTIAGVLYAQAARRRGSIGDAAAAHAVTNALLAVWVLLTGDWRLW